MLSQLDVADLSTSSRRDVLSVALDVDPTKPEHQDEVPAYRIWLRNELRALLERLPEDARRQAREPAGRVREFVERERLQGRGLAIFAAPDLWRVHVLPVPLRNQVRYGPPDVLPLLWALDEYEPYAILVVNRERARLLVAYLGGTVVAEAEALELDTHAWRFAAGGPPSFTKAAGMGVGRGAQRDTFDARVDDNLRRLWTGAAEATDRWLQEARIDRLIVSGPEEASSAVRDLLPDLARAKLVAVVPLPGEADVAEMHRLTLPVALAEEHRRETELVEDVITRAPGNAGAVVGVRQTLQALGREQVRTLVVDRDLDAGVQQCLRCSSVSADAAPACPVCGGPLERVRVGQVLPLLARRSGARIETVGGNAASQLRAYGGLGAVLRYAIP